jgi:hypothetical protein
LQALLRGWQGTAAREDLGQGSGTEGDESLNSRCGGVGGRGIWGERRRGWGRDGRNGAGLDVRGWDGR